MPSAPLSVAAVQAESERGEVAANATRVAAIVRRTDARVLVWPEKFLSGYEPELVSSDPSRYAVTADDSRLAPIADACRDTGRIAVVGAATRAGGDLFISSLVFGPSGDVTARYDKQFLFGGERGVFTAGTRGCTLEVDGWRLGLAVCYDCGFGEHARAAAADDAHAYLVSALFSVGGGYHESRIWLPARALDNQVYVLLSNHVGETGGWSACGSSGIWDPRGHLVDEAGPDDPEVITAELNPAVLKSARESSRLTDLRSAPALNARQTITV